MNNKGISLIFAIFFISFLLIISLGMIRSAYNSRSTIHLEKDHLTALYLSEGAIEIGKSRLISNPNWYTDAAMDGKLSDWLKNRAKGETTARSDKLSLKTVKIFNRSALYGIGYCRGSCAIIKYENGKFEEI
ncbi:hypothetical protein HZC34_00510 [Candidatus Saganbacteria bacterium]|nr:hypothetical protein [Candidatus Saganbacteria bacterium]